MRKREQLLWDAFRANMPARLWLQRVENLVGEGMPDVYIGLTGKWVEMKAPDSIPKRKDTPLLGEKFGLRTSQINWLHKNHLHRSDTAYILIRTNKRELFFLSSHYALELNKMTYDEIAKASCASSWNEIAAILAKDDIE